MNLQHPMDRREALGMLGIAGATAAIPGIARAAQQTKSDTVKAAAPSAKNPHQRIMDDCLKACGDCMDMCNKAAHHCFEQVGAGKGEHARPLHMTIDCQEFCATAAALIGRSSPLMNVGCDACARACDDCAQACEKFSSDEQMAACGASCRACAKSCREMVAVMGGAKTHP